MTNDKLALLRDEILTGPLAAELAPLVAAGSAATIADTLNRADIPGSTPCNATLAKKLLIKRGLWRGIVAASNDAVHPAHVAACAAVDIADSAGMTIDFYDADAAPLLSALVVSGLITAAVRSELESLCSTLVSRSKIIGIPVDHISVSRSLVM